MDGEKEMFMDGENGGENGAEISLICSHTVIRRKVTQRIQRAVKIRIRRNMNWVWMDKVRSKALKKGKFVRGKEP